MPGPIRGISKTNLWKSWKAVRKELKSASVRDVIDFLDYDVNPDFWIKRLLTRIGSGAYEPETPRRFTLGKSKGFSRTMTFPAIPDLVLYRTIVDYIYERSKGRRHKHVYFLRDQISKAKELALQQARHQMETAKGIDYADGEYRITGRRSFLNWLCFDQYRKLLIFEEVHTFFVVADIANFFDTILHSHVEEAVRGLSVPPRMSGLLFFLLERLSSRQDYSSSHGISLPTDEFDCSRTLAHMILYPHDDAMVQLVGEYRYIRWMDDQNMAVDTRAKALQVLGEVGRSLGRLHLTPNAQKSKIMDLAEARRQHHLDINQMLDDAEELAKKVRNKTKARKNLAMKLRGIWRKAKRHDGVGEFGKILKRIYRLAGFSGLDILRNRAAADIVAEPSMVERVLSYYRCTGSTSEYLAFVEGLMDSPEQVYPDVNVAMAESLLRLEPSQAEVPRLRKLARRLLLREKSLPGSDDCAAVGPLLILRFGDRRSLPTLRSCFENHDLKIPLQCVRAAGIVYLSYGVKASDEMRHVAGAMLRNHLSTLVRLVAEIHACTDVPDRYKARLGLSWDSVAGVKYVDMRVLLMARLLLLSKSRAVRDWVVEWRNRISREEISDYDRLLLSRLVK